MMEQRPRILALYPSLPSMTKAAGDKTAFKFVETLHRLGHRITLLSFAYNGYDENDYRALEPLCEKIVLHDFGKREKLGNILRGWFISPTLAARRSTGFGRLIDVHIGAADLVHIEFTELLPWARYIKERYPGKRVCYVAHDIVFQKKYREAGKHLFLNPWRDLDLLLTWRCENMLLGFVDRVIVQNDKDAALIPRHAARMSVVVPYAEKPHIGDSKGVDGLPESYVVYFGAMSRPENYLAALSFIRRCWPELRREFPDLCFYVVGSRPHQRLQDLNGQDNIVITGFVEDPYVYLANALLTVAPITLGAGIKVKVLESLMVGSPVVAFPAGAEGINLKREDGLTVVGNYADMLQEIRMMLIRGPAVSGEHIRTAVGQAFDWTITENFLLEDYR
jgi:glycosyltransferase involved in cell wall biosynthesis